MTPEPAPTIAPTGLTALTAALLVAGAPLVVPGTLTAQSIIGSGGLGVPVAPVDARSRALGNVGIGLSGSSILPTDPAAAADLRLPAISFTLAHSWVDLEAENVEPTASGSRFPVLGIAYPVGGAGMVTGTFGAAFDQRWESEIERLVDLGPDEQARVRDLFRSDGGVSAARIGYASRIAPSLAVGIAAGTYLGDVSRVFTRHFDSLSIESNVPSFSTGGRWTFSAPTVTGGAQVDVGEVLRVAASLTWSGSLEADPDETTDGPARSFDLPLEYRAGATGVLAQGLQLSASLYYADWSDSGAGFSGGGGRATFDVGAGLEWEDGSLFGRRAPLRVGYRRSELPFRFDGSEATESVWAAGLGLNLVESGETSLAQVDVAVERGDRSATTLTESFWRMALTFRVAGQ